MNNNNGRNGSKTRHLNMIILEGHLGADPQMRYLPTGTPITKFRIGTNYSWTTATGEVKSETTWTVIEFIGKLAEIANQYLQTGSHVVVEGRLRPLQTWEHENKFYANQVVAGRTLRILDKLKGSGAPAEELAGDEAGAPAEDDIPF